MDFEQVVRRRRMVRNYDPDRPVARSRIEQLLELALHAPSAGFSQGWRFLVLDERADVERYWAACAGDGAEDSWLAGMRRAPVLIVAFADKQAYLRRYAEPDKGRSVTDEAAWAVPYWDVDTGMAALLLLLGVVDAGLAACLFGVPGDRWAALSDAFGVPAGLRPVAAISVGYPAPDRPSPSLRRGRRPVDDVAVFGRFPPSPPELTVR